MGLKKFPNGPYSPNGSKVKSLSLPPFGQINFILTVQIKSKPHISFIHSLIHLLNKYVLIIHHVLVNRLKPAI